MGKRQKKIAIPNVTTDHVEELISSGMLSVNPNAFKPLKLKEHPTIKNMLIPDETNESNSPSNWIEEKFIEWLGNIAPYVNSESELEILKDKVRLILNELEWE